MSTSNAVKIDDYQEWDPQRYLTDYYSEVLADERLTLGFMVEMLRKLPEVEVALDFGCGPTVHHLLPLVQKARTVHLAEYLESNRVEVQRWLARDAKAHDWRLFTKEVLHAQGIAQPTEADIRATEEAARLLVTSVTAGNAFDEDPLGPAKRGFYPLVTSHYCAENATSNQAEWRICMRNILSLVAPGGTLILSAVGENDFYEVGDKNFPCANINGVDMLGALQENGFQDVELHLRRVPNYYKTGFNHLILVRAQKLP